MIDPARLTPIAARDLYLRPQLLPQAEGVYLIYFDSGQLVLERSGYLDFDSRYPVSVDGYDLLYVGATRDNLRLRALAHVAGDSRASSLRMTVGMVLAGELGLEPVGDPAAPTSISATVSGG